MTKLLRRLQQNQEGLTLIELIVVVAIIAVLAFTMTPRVLNALNNSKLSSAKSVANELHSAMERYYANAGLAAGATPAYPAPAAGLSTAAARWGDLKTKLGDSLALSSNTDDVFNSPLVFDFTGDGTTYCLRFEARDSNTTEFKITPTGVESADTGLTCP